MLAPSSSQHQRVRTWKGKERYLRANPKHLSPAKPPSHNSGSTGEEQVENLVWDQSCSMDEHLMPENDWKVMNSAQDNFKEWEEEILQVYHKHRVGEKSALYITEFGFLNKLVIYLSKAPGTLHYTHSHVCFYSTVDVLPGIMKITIIMTIVIVKRRMAFLYCVVSICIHLYLQSLMGKIN